MWNTEPNEEACLFVPKIMELTAYMEEFCDCSISGNHLQHPPTKLNVHPLQKSIKLFFKVKCVKCGFSSHFPILKATYNTGHTIASGYSKMSAGFLYK